MVGQACAASLFQNGLRLKKFLNFKSTIFLFSHSTLSADGKPLPTSIHPFTPIVSPPYFLNLATPLLSSMQINSFIIHRNR